MILVVDRLSRPIVVLDGLPGLYGLKYDSATACGPSLYLCSYKLVGSVTEVWKMLKRSSPGLAKSNNEDSMQKVKKRTAWENLDFSGGNTTDLSLIPFSINSVSSSVNNLGVSLGNAPESKRLRSTLHAE